MKKTLIIAAGLASFGLSMNASAAAIAGTNAGAVTAITTSNCALLSEDVNINLSANVAAGYACNTGTNIIGVATCHPNGRKPDDTNNYIFVGSSAGGSVNSATPDSVCDSAGSAANTKATTAASGS